MVRVKSETAPTNSLLARVALHALQFGNVRAVAILWRRFVRELRFAHWDRGVPLPRMGRESEVSDDDSAHDPALDQPDVSACPLHQMLQLLDACIRRRKVASRAALDASDVAKEARERAEKRAGAHKTPAEASQKKPAAPAKPAGEITLERRGGGAPPARVVEPPSKAMTGSTGGYVPPHLRNAAPREGVKDAWDDD